MDVGGLARQDEAEDLWSLPDGWVWADLRDVGSWTSGGTPRSNEPNYYDGPIPWFRITDLNEGRLRKAERSLTERGLNESSAKVIAAPFLMFAMYGASIGKMAISEIDAATNQAIACCSPSRIVDIDYLFWALQRLKHNFIALGQGGAQPNISQRILLECKVPIAPLAEQRRIVARIDALFAEIAEGEAALAEARKGLDIFRRALVKAAVTGELTRDWRAANLASETGEDLLAGIAKGRAKVSAQKARARRARDAKPIDIIDLPKLPPSWVWATIRELGDVVGGLTKNPNREKLSAKLPYLRVANVQLGHLDLSEVKEIGVTNEERQRASLQQGDLLIVEGNGSIDQIGRCAIWNGEVAECVHQNHIIKVRFPELGLSQWCFTWLLSPHGRHEIEQVAASTSGLHTLSISKVESLPIPIPPAAEATEIWHRVSDAIAASADTLAVLDAEAADAARLKQSILKAAFAGRLAPQDPTDEPASALLARLTADRSEVPAKRRRANSARSKDLAS